MGYFSLENDVEFRYNELLKEAAQERLARQIRAQKPGVPTRTLQGLGDVLISMGKNLKSLSLTL